MERIKDFHKVALVTDTGWHEIATKVWGAMMPEVEVSCFKPEERAAAEAWIRA